MKDQLKSFMSNCGERILEYGKNQKSDLLWDMIGVASQYFPSFKLFSGVIKTGVAIKERVAFDKLYKSIMDAFDSRESRKRIFSDLLKTGFPERTKSSIIILDNFQLLASNELGRDHSWLTKHNGLLRELPDVFWVIGSRSNQANLFDGIWSNEAIESIQILGFNDEQAGRYIHEKCDEDNVVNKAIVEAMIKACAFVPLNEDTNIFFKRDDNSSSEEKDGSKKESEAKLKREKDIEKGKDAAGKLETVTKSEDKSESTYLPYLLNMITDYYLKLSKDPTVTISESYFVQLKDTDTFIGRYFYMNLTDLMINAFQILSCLTVWNEGWTEIVRLRFDNHLLNAMNLLYHTAPIEHLGNGKYKLHEAVRDALFNNSENYIKIDVLEYLFNLFVELYFEKEFNLNQEVIEKKYRDIDSIMVYVESAFHYIGAIPDGEKRHEKFNQLAQCIDNIHRYNEKRGEVTENYCRLYHFYVDAQNKLYKFGLFEIDEYIKKGGKPITSGMFKNVLENIGAFFQYLRDMQTLANLYTNSNQEERAIKIERIGIAFLNHTIIALKDNPERLEDFYQAQVLYLAYMNGLAFDLSANHEYVEAERLGRWGLEQGREIISSLFPKLNLKFAGFEGFQDFLEAIVLLSEDKTVIPKNLEQIQNVDAYSKLIEFYKEIYSSFIKEKSEQHNPLLANIIELLFDVYQKLRGNYAWYWCKSIKEETILKGFFPMSAYGHCTYLQRKAIVDALRGILNKKEMQQSDNKTKTIKEEVESRLKKHTKMMLQSLHNIGVYRKEEANLIQNSAKSDAKSSMDNQYKQYLNEAINWLSWATIQREQCLISFSFDSETNMQRQRRESILAGDGGQFYGYLYNKVNINKNILFTLHPDVLESMQYLGDIYYLLGRFDDSYDIIEHVLLERYVRLGEYDSKTLDSFKYFFRTIKEFDKNKVNASGIEDYVEEIYSNKNGLFDAGIQEKLNKIVGLRGE